MAFSEVSFSVERSLVPGAEAALEAEGALAVTLLDQAGDPVLEPAAGEVRLWPVVELRALFAADTDRDRVLSALRALPGLVPSAVAAWRTVEDRDWERAWLERFRPMRFGERLWIVPTGMDLPADPGACVVRLDPGLAFGTGTHATTALCLDWIDGHDFSACRVVDYGCGSGVLGIAAARKGAAEVICVDHDSQALTATAANAARNGVTDRVRCVAPEAFDRMTADIVLANILAAPLIELAPRIGGCLAPGGRIVLCGILAGQADAVASAYRPFAGSMHGVERDGWVRLDGVASGSGEACS